VATLYANKQFFDIARYNAADVVATKELHEIWLKNLAPVSFLNTRNLQ
jgi:hypothetical protein